MSKSPPTSKPPPLQVKIQSGDLVRIIAPAGAGSPGNLPAIKAYVESLELVAQISDGIYGDDPFYSNTDEARASDLISALKNPLCKVIWCIRGGAGCIRLIPYLDKEFSSPAAPPPGPKLLIGYSDITVLHLYFNQKFGWPTLHGPMLEGIVNGQYDPEGDSVMTLRDLLFNRINSVCEPVMTRLDSRGPIGLISTEVIGGNLTIVETSVGTGWEIKGIGKILFFEDVGEAAYGIERSLDHMKQAGVFESAAAIVFGDFSNPDDPNLVQLVLQRFAEDKDFIPCPVFSLKGIGHRSINSPLPFGTNAEINLEDQALNLYLLCVNNTTSTF